MRRLACVVREKKNMGRRKTDPKKMLALLNQEATKATGGSSAIVFTSVLGSGAHGTVVTAKVSHGTLPSGFGKCRTLSDSDPNPAVKVTEGTAEDLKSAEREYELARWAAANKLGPSVYCSALWATKQGVRHLLFMEHLWGTLSDLTEGTKHYPTKNVLKAQQHAWLLAFLQTQTMSEHRLLGADLKPANFLVRFNGPDVTGVYITDWDDTFWFVADRKDDALLYDFFCLTVNTMFIIRRNVALDKQWVPDICQFVYHLISKWSTTSEFLAFLIDHDEVNKVGPYHYAEHYALQVDGVALSKKATPTDRAKRFLKAFNFGIKDRWGSRMFVTARRLLGPSLAATKIGDKRFEVKSVVYNNSNRLLKTVVPPPQSRQPAAARALSRPQLQPPSHNSNRPLKTVVPSPQPRQQAAARALSRSQLQPPSPTPGLAVAARSERPTSTRTQSIKAEASRSASSAPHPSGSGLG